MTQTESTKKKRILLAVILSAIALLFTIALIILIILIRVKRPNLRSEMKLDEIPITGLRSFDFIENKTIPEYPSDNLGNAGRLILDCYTGTCIHDILHTDYSIYCDSDDSCYTEDEFWMEYRPTIEHYCSEQCYETGNDECNCSEPYEDIGTCENKMDDKYENGKVCYAYNTIYYWKGKRYTNLNTDIYYYLDDALYGIKFSKNKLDLMNACFDGKVENWDKYFPSYFGYHDRYDEIEKEELEKFWNDDHSTFKGFTPFFYNESLPTPKITSSDVKAPSEKSQKYLKKIIDYTNEHGIQLYITIVPYRLNCEQQEGTEQHEDLRFNWLENYVEELKSQGINNVRFDYTFKHLDDIGIDFEGGSDIADGNSHLNYYGSTKFAKYLSEDLRKVYGEELIPDHRGDAAYSSWDGHVEEIRSKVAQAGWEWR